MTKILLVEDDKSLREIYGVRLMAEGYEITSAGDGEEALAMAIKERPVLIVSDVMMPKISGFDMLDILRSTGETKDIKIIMMTALSSEDQRARGESLGADRYLVKSQVGIEDVVRTVHEVLGDVPNQAPTPAQTFNAPSTPAMPPRPASPTPVAVPARPVEPVAATPMMSPQPMAQPVINTPQEPVVSAAPIAMPLPISAPVIQTPPATLPQPTAPFSTPRPASLGETIINPPSMATPQPATQDMASLMSQELNSSATAPTEPSQTPPSAPPTA